MKSILYLLALLFSSAIIGCTSTPDYVVDEDTMVLLMADIHKGEAYGEKNNGRFYSDSTKKYLKQSVLLKYGVTPQQFDTSLVWYGKHIDKYVEIYKKVIEKLSEEEQQIIAEAKKMGTETPLAAGDSVDMWSKSSMRIISKLGADSVITFILTADNDFRKGDVYYWRFRLHSSETPIRVMMGADYNDGSFSYYEHRNIESGWNKVRFQCDSAKQLRKIYGVISMNKSAKSLEFLDSIQLVRTRLDKRNYYLINKQLSINTNSAK